MTTAEDRFRPERSGPERSGPERSRLERLLVVEDDDFSLQLIELYLRKAGFSDITIATDGRQGLDLVRKETFDLVLLDLNLPRLSGVEVLRRLKREGRLAEGGNAQGTPVLVLSSLTDFDETVRCVELGAEDYLAKPFNAVLLQARIDACLERRRMASRIAAERIHEQQQLEGGRALQASLLRVSLPPAGPEFPVEVATLFDPAPALGGALIDAFALGDGTVCLSVGTVSGHGIPAVLGMARTRSLVRAALEPARSGGSPPMAPGDVLAYVNRDWCRDNALGQSVTLFFGLLEPKTGVLRFACVGQPSPCVFSAHDGVHALTGEPGRVLGLEPDQHYRSAVWQLEAMGGLAVFTDSILTVPDRAAAPFGRQNLMASLQALLRDPPETALNALKTELDRHRSGTALKEDLAVLALRLQKSSTFPGEAQGWDGWV